MTITINLFMELEEEEIEKFITDFATSDDCQKSCKNKNELTEYIIRSLCKLMENHINYSSDAYIQNRRICDNACEKIIDEVWSLWKTWGES